MFETEEQLLPLKDLLAFEEPKLIDTMAMQTYPFEPVELLCRQGKKLLTIKPPQSGWNSFRIKEVLVPSRVYWQCTDIILRDYWLGGNEL